MMNFHCEKIDGRERRGPKDSMGNGAQDVCAACRLSSGPSFQTSYGIQSCSCSQSDCCAHSLVCVGIWKTPESVFAFRSRSVSLLLLAMASPPKLFVFSSIFRSLQTLACLAFVPFHFNFFFPVHRNPNKQQKITSMDECKRRERENVFRSSKSHAAIY